MAPRKKKVAPTDAQLADQATAEHHQVLVEHPLPDPTDFDPAKLEPLVPASSPVLLDSNPASPIVQSVADSTRIDDEEAERAKYGSQESHDDHQEIASGSCQEPLAGRDWSRFADPARRQAVEFPDGYRISVQESPSRRTVEIQFDSGDRDSRPLNFEPIKQVLTEEGMRWNGTNAWVKDLASPRGHESEAEKLDRQRYNARIRAHVEDVVFPQVVALEEDKRGPVQSDVIRERIAQLASGPGR